VKLVIGAGIACVAAAGVLALCGIWGGEPAGPPTTGDFATAGRAEVLWRREIDVVDEAWIKELAADEVGNAYVAGVGIPLAPDGSRRDGSGYVGFLVKYGPDGEILRKCEMGSGGTWLNDIAIDANGDIVVVGSEYPGLNQDQPNGAAERGVFVARYDREGQRRWVCQFGGESGSEKDSPSRPGEPDVQQGWSADYVAVDEAGNCYVLCRGPGGAFLGGGDGEVYIVKIDISGRVAWRTNCGWEAGDFGRDIVADETGCYASTYWLNSRTDSASFEPSLYRDDSPGGWLVRCNAAGELEWRKRFPRHLGYDLAVDQEGDCWLAGAAYGRGYQDSNLILVDRQGDVLWTRQPEPQIREVVRSLSISGDECYAGIVVETWRRRWGDRFEFWDGAYIGAYDSAGDRRMLWQMPVNMPESLDELVATDSGCYVLLRKASGDDEEPEPIPSRRPLIAKLRMAAPTR
jgi:hypothetical protein